MSSLYIVSTPIGNMEDITLRALKVLESVELILAEDTRTSGQLLKRHNISTQLTAFHAHNEHKRVDSVLAEIEEGKDMALISDAGTPGISDPGYLLINRAIEKGVNVEVIPGATAFVPALLKSGFPTEKFVYEGFLPHKKGRLTRLKSLEEEQRTMVFYESPHRVSKTLQQFTEHFGDDREVSVSRELTKKFEETVNGTIKELAAHFEAKKPKGEFVIVVKGKSK